MLGAVAGFSQNRQQISDRPVGLRDDAALDDLAAFPCNLAGNMEPTVRLNRAGEWQRLAVSAGLLGAVTLDGHSLVLANYFLDALTNDHIKRNLTREKRCL